MRLVDWTSIRVFEAHASSTLYVLDEELEFLAPELVQRAHFGQMSTRTPIAGVSVVDAGSRQEKGMEEEEAEVTYASEMWFVGVLAFLLCASNSSFCCDCAFSSVSISKPLWHSLSISIDSPAAHRSFSRTTPENLSSNGFSMLSWTSAITSGHISVLKRENSSHCSSRVTCSTHLFLNFHFLFHSLSLFLPLCK